MRRAAKSEDGAQAAKPRGRPSDDSIDRSLLESALEEFTVRGYHAMSMESIAGRAGVSKVSLYRRWDSKSAIVADLFRLLRDKSPPIDHGSLEADIRALIEESIGSNEATAAGRILLRTMGEISGNAELLGLYREQLLDPRLEQLRAVVERSRARGELRADLPTDLACALIAGPLFLYYLTLLAGTDVDLSSEPADRLTRAILGGISLGGISSTPIGDMGPP
jgi:AcrR family transcriptional regulator